MCEGPLQGKRIVPGRILIARENAARTETRRWNMQQRSTVIPFYFSSLFAPPENTHFPSLSEVLLVVWSHTQPPPALSCMCIAYLPLPRGQSCRKLMNDLDPLKYKPQ